jgi:hypothetical protein
MARRLSFLHVGFVNPGDKLTASKKDSATEATEFAEKRRAQKLWIDKQGTAAFNANAQEQKYFSLWSQRALW